MKTATLRLKNGESIPKNFTGMVELPDGRKHWYKEGLLHRLDGPAFESLYGTKYWYKEGKFHREDGPAVECRNGDKFWYKEGKLHRENGPAREFTNGDKEWYKKGNHHREDGPAVEYTTGEKEWWIENREYNIGYLNFLYKEKIFLGKERGQYNLEWLKFLTEEGIKEFPIMPGMKSYFKFKRIFKKLSLEI